MTWFNVFILLCKEIGIIQLLFSDKSPPILPTQLLTIKSR